MDPMRRGRGVITQSWRKAMKAVRVCAVLALAALGMGGCTPDFAKGAGDVTLVINSVNAGSPLQSDVEIQGPGTPPQGGVCADFVKVNLNNAFKNPTLPTAGSFANDILLQHYEIHYIRSDGRNVEGVDVPYSISGLLTARIPAGVSTQDVFIEVVRIQAKEEAPLKALDFDGGSIIVTMFADITLHAVTASGKVLDPVTGRLQIDFSNYGDTLTTCPVTS
jgi:hypothetical protein